MSSPIYEIALKRIDGNEILLSDYKNKKMMIINVASQCGFTNQYAQLQELYNKYQDELVIIGCPSNDFGGQEPDGHKEIKYFCELNYGVTFPLSEKLSIKESPHELYAWLTQMNQNGTGDFNVKWNFHKFLINEDGQIYKSLPSNVEPFSEVILQWLQPDV